MQQGETDSSVTSLHERFAIYRAIPGQFRCQRLGINDFPVLFRLRKFPKQVLLVFTQALWLYPSMRSHPEIHSADRMFEERNIDDQSSANLRGFLFRRCLCASPPPLVQTNASSFIQCSTRNPLAPESILCRSRFSLPAISLRSSSNLCSHSFFFAKNFFNDATRDGKHRRV